MKPNSSPSLLLASFGFTTTYAAPEFSWPTFTPQTLFSSGLVSGPLGKYVNTFVLSFPLNASAGLSLRIIHLIAMM